MMRKRYWIKISTWILVQLFFFANIVPSWSEVQSHLRTKSFASSDAGVQKFLRDLQGAIPFVASVAKDGSFHLGPVLRNVSTRIDRLLEGDPNQDTMGRVFATILREEVLGKKNDFAREVRLQEIVEEAKTKPPVDFHYTRRVLYHDPKWGYDVVAIVYVKNKSYLRGEYTFIHNHGGQVCVFCVFEGEGMEYQFEERSRSGGEAELVFTHRKSIGEGDIEVITATQNPIHVVGNFGMSDYTVEIAIYQKSLTETGVDRYDPLEGSFADLLSQNLENWPILAEVNRIYPPTARDSGNKIVKKPAETSTLEIAGATFLKLTASQPKATLLIPEPIDPQVIAQLKERGDINAVILRPESELVWTGKAWKAFSQAHLLEAVRQVNPTAIVGYTNLRYDRELMEAAPNLRGIYLFSTGRENVAHDEARRRGIVATYAPGPLTELVTEHNLTFALDAAFDLTENLFWRERSGWVSAEEVLSSLVQEDPEVIVQVLWGELLRRVQRLDSQYRHVEEGKFRRTTGVGENATVLHDQLAHYPQIGVDTTLGLVGLGAVGKRLVEIASAFGLKETRYYVPEEERDKTLEKEFSLTYVSSPQEILESSYTIVLPGAGEFIPDLGFRREIVDPRKIWIEPQRTGELRGESLFGKTARIAGLGRIGSATAKRAIALGMNVVAIEKNPREEVVTELNRFQEAFATRHNQPVTPLQLLSPDKKETFFKKANAEDVFFIQFDPSPEVFHWIDERALALLGDTPVTIVNTARGKLIDTEALIRYADAHPNSRIRVDVLENETEDTEKGLAERPNVRITPHAASANSKVRHKMQRVALDENFFAVLDGKSPSTPMPEVPLEEVVARRMLSEAIQSANAYEAVKQQVSYHPSKQRLVVQGRTYHLSDVKNIYVIGYGKASGEMAKALAEILGNRITSGVVNVAGYEEKKKYNGTIKPITFYAGDHPIPGLEGPKGTEEMLALVRQAGPQDMVITLISGGGSAIGAHPIFKMTLKDLQDLYQLLESTPIPIHEKNIIRKHLDARVDLLKISRDAKHFVSLVISDVPGDDPRDIASGYTVGDTSTFHDVKALLQKYHLWGRIPTSIQNFIEQNTIIEPIFELVRPYDKIFKDDRVQTALLAGNRPALERAAEVARSFGFKTKIVDELLRKTVDEEADRIVEMILDAQGNEPVVLLWGGETVVKVPGGAGRGGRNSHLAGKVAGILAEFDLRDITFLAATTDGKDGAWEGAGVVVTSDTKERAQKQGLGLSDSLSRYDSGTFAQKLGIDIVTGDTQTNVMDVAFAFLPAKSAQDSGRKKLDLKTDPVLRKVSQILINAKKRGADRIDLVAALNKAREKGILASTVFIHEATRFHTDDAVSLYLGEQRIILGIRPKGKSYEVYFIPTEKYAEALARRVASTLSRNFRITTTVRRGRIGLANLIPNQKIAFREEIEARKKEIEGGEEELLIVVKPYHAKSYIIEGHHRAIALQELGKTDAEAWIVEFEKSEEGMGAELRFAAEWTQLGLPDSLSKMQIVSHLRGETWNAIRDGANKTAAELAKENTVWFDDLGILPTHEGVPIAGGKMHQTAVLRARKVPSFDGFVVTATAAYRGLLAHNTDLNAFVNGERVGNLRDFIYHHLKDLDTKDDEKRSHTAAHVREAILKAEIPFDVRTDILRAYRTLSEKELYPDHDLPTAVRSSGAKEDLPGKERSAKAKTDAVFPSGVSVASAGGRHDTYLNTIGEELVVQRFLEDIASTYTERAVNYRDHQIIYYFMEQLGAKRIEEILKVLTDDEDPITLEVARTLKERKVDATSHLRMKNVLRRHDLLQEVALLEKTAEDFIDPGRVTMAVGIMPMGDFDVSFVMFGIEPRSGWTALSFQNTLRNIQKGSWNSYQPRVFKIDFNYRLGESIVQGIVDPDSFLVHTFVDRKGQRRVNVWPLTLGTKRLQVIYRSHLLKETGFTEEDIHELTEHLERYRHQGGASGIRYSASLRHKLFKGVLEPRLLALDALDALVREKEDKADEVALDEDTLAFLNMDRETFIRLAHLVKATMKDPRSGVVTTIVPEALRERFSVVEAQVADTIRKIGFPAAEDYPHLLDVEGGRGTIKQEPDQPVAVQRRPITSEADINEPTTVRLDRWVIKNETLEAVRALGQEIEPRIIRGETLAAGVTGRHAFTGEIFVIDEHAEEPLSSQFKRASRRAEELKREGRHIIIMTRETTPDYEPVMAISGGVMTEVGGDTSHAAIIAREMGISAVVGILKSLDELKATDKELYERVYRYLHTNGYVVTVDANRGEIYAGAVDRNEEHILIALDQLYPTSTKIGLIIGLPGPMQDVSKLALYPSHYGVSLKRAEFAYAHEQINPRAGVAYDHLLLRNYFAVQEDPSYREKLSRPEQKALETLERQLRWREEVRRLGVNVSFEEIEEKIRAGKEDFEKGLNSYAQEDLELLRNHPDVITFIRERILGYISYSEFYRKVHGASDAQVAAANHLSQSVLVRAVDFKKNEARRILAGTTMFDPEPEQATMLGVRGARWLLQPENQVILRKEIETLLYWVDQGYENLGYFFPFVATPQEMIQLLQILEEVQAEKKVFFKKVGQMVELPSNVLQADQFAEALVDYRDRIRKKYHKEVTVFFSFGTNDLTQTTMGADRDNPLVAHLMNEAHPFVVESIRHVVQVARKYGIECGLCGQAIVKLVDKDPETAEEIMALLDSVGTDYLGYRKAVQRGLSADLNNGVLEAETIQKAHVLLTGQSFSYRENVSPKGAASRRIYIVKSKGDLAKLKGDDFVVLTTILDLGDPEVKEALGNVGAIIWDARAVYGERGDYARAQFRHLLRKPEIYVAGAANILGRHERKQITIDFRTGVIYQGNLPVVIRPEVKPDKVPIREEGGKPAEIRTTSVRARDLYLSLSKGLYRIHPLNYLYYEKEKERGEEVLMSSGARATVARVVKGQSAKAYYQSVLRRKLLERIQKKEGGVLMVYETSDLTSEEFRDLLHGRELTSEEVNPPIGFSGLDQFTHPHYNYRELLKWEFEVVKQLQDEGYNIAIQLNSVKVPEQIKQAILLMKDVGIEPGKDGFQVGMNTAWPGNYLAPEEFFKEGISFITIDPTALAQAYLAADLTGNPGVRTAYPDEVIRENLKRAVNSITIAAERTGIKLAAPLEAERLRLARDGALRQVVRQAHHPEQSRGTQDDVLSEQSESKDGGSREEIRHHAQRLLVTLEDLLPKLKEDKEIDSERQRTRSRLVEAILRGEFLEYPDSDKLNLMETQRMVKTHFGEVEGEIVLRMLRAAAILASLTFENEKEIRKSRTLAEQILSDLTQFASDKESLRAPWHAPRDASGQVIVDPRYQAYWEAIREERNWNNKAIRQFVEILEEEGLGEILKRFAKSGETFVIVEVGTGNGPLIWALLDLLKEYRVTNFKILATDVNPLWLASGYKHHAGNGNVEFYLVRSEDEKGKPFSDFESLAAAVGGQKAHLVVGSHVPHLIQDFEKFVEGVQATLHPKGVAAFQSLNIDYDGRYLEDGVGPVLIDDTANATHDLAVEISGLVSEEAVSKALPTRQKTFLPVRHQRHYLDALEKNGFKILTPHTFPNATIYPAEYVHVPYEEWGKFLNLELLRGGILPELNDHPDVQAKVIAMAVDQLFRKMKREGGEKRNPFMGQESFIAASTVIIAQLPAAADGANRHAEVYQREFQGRFGKRLEAGDFAIIGEIENYHDTLLPDDPVRQILYEWLQHHESKLAAKALAAIGLNWEDVVQHLTDIAFGAKEGNPRAALRQLRELETLKTYGGLPAPPEVSHQARATWNQHRFILSRSPLLRPITFPPLPTLRAKRAGTLVLVRHGETTWSEAVLDRWAGWHDSQITERGRREALQAGERVRVEGLHFDQAYSSDLSRAKETLVQFLSGIGQTHVPVIRDRSLRERNYGNMIGWNRRDVVLAFGEKVYKRWRRGYEGDDVRPPGGENLKDVQERAVPFFVEKVLSDIASGKNVVISAHGNSLRSILVYLREKTEGRTLTEKEILKLEVPLSTPIVITFDSQLHHRELWVDAQKGPREVSEFLTARDGGASKKDQARTERALGLVSRLSFLVRTTSGPGIHDAGTVNEWAGRYRLDPEAVKELLRSSLLFKISAEGRISFEVGAGDAPRISNFEEKGKQWANSVPKAFAPSRMKFYPQLPPEVQEIIDRQVKVAMQSARLNKAQRDYLRSTLSERLARIFSGRSYPYKSEQSLYSEFLRKGFEIPIRSIHEAVSSVYPLGRYFRGQIDWQTAYRRLRLNKLTSQRARSWLMAVEASRSARDGSTRFARSPSLWFDELTIPRTIPSNVEGEPSRATSRDGGVRNGGTRVTLDESFQRIAKRFAKAKFDDVSSRLLFEEIDRTAETPDIRAISRVLAYKILIQKNIVSPFQDPTLSDLLTPYRGSTKIVMSASRLLDPGFSRQGLLDFLKMTENYLYFIHPSEDVAQMLTRRRTSLLGKLQKEGRLVSQNLEEIQDAPRVVLILDEKDRSALDITPDKLLVPTFLGDVKEAFIIPVGPTAGIVRELALALGLIRQFPAWSDLFTLDATTQLFLIEVVTGLDTLHPLTARIQGDLKQAELLVTTILQKL